MASRARTAALGLGVVMSLAALDAPAQGAPPPSGAMMPAAPLPDPRDTAAVHRYIETLAFDPDEARAMLGFEVLTSAGAPYAEALAALYLNPQGDARCRWVAGQALGRMRSDTASRALRQGLTDALPLARLAAVQALPTQRPADARQLLELSLKDAAAVVRASAADSLAKLGDPAAVPALVAAWEAPVNVYKGKSLFVRHHVLDALGSLPGSEGLPTLLAALDSPEVDIQEAAQRALLTKSGLPAPPPGSGTEAARWKAYYQR